MKSTNDKYEPKRTLFLHREKTGDVASERIADMNFLMRYVRMPHQMLKAIVENLFYHSNKMTVIMIAINCYVLSCIEIIFLMDLIRCAFA